MASILALGSLFWDHAQPCGLRLSWHKSMGDSRQGGSSLGHHVLPVGLRSGPWGCIHRCHRSIRLNHLFLSIAVSTLCLPHFLRGNCCGTHVACAGEVLFLGPPEPKDKATMPGDSWGKTSASCLKSCSKRHMEGEGKVWAV